MGKCAVLLLVILLASSIVVALLPVVVASKTIVVPYDYATISAAIASVEDGDTIFVNRGNYEEETLEITKTLSLIGEGAESTRISLSPELKVSFPPDLPPDLRKLETSYYFDPSIKVNASDFRLEGFTIDTPNIIAFKDSNPNMNGENLGGTISVAGNGTKIVRNKILTALKLEGSNCTVEGNTLLDEVTVTGSYSTIFANNFSGIIWASGSYLNVSANSKSDSNKMVTMDIGIYLRGSSCLIFGNNLTAKGLSSGIGVEGNDNFVVKNFVDQSDIGMRIAGSNNAICLNRITNSWEDYFYPSSTPITGIGIVASGNNAFYANYVANNSWGININQYQANSRSLVYKNNFIGNTKQVATDNPYNTYGNDSFDNGESGNFWSDYIGKDANVDGVGDTSYVIEAKRQDNYPLMAPFDIESVTVPLPDWASYETKASEPFPTVPLLAVSVSIVAIVGVGLLVYFRKRKR